MPITWRNVDGPSLEGVSKILDSAGTTMNAGFDKLNQVIKTREDTQASNWEAEKANNTRAAIDKLMSTKTPAELEAMKASGELDQFAAQFGDQFDQAKMREAVTGQMKSLRGEQVDSYNHGKTMTAQRSDPLFEEFDQAGERGDLARQDELINQNHDLGWGKKMAEAEARKDAKGQREHRLKIDPIKNTNEYYAALREGENAERDRANDPLRHQIATTGLKDEADTQRVANQLKTLEKETAMAVQAHRTRQDKLGKELGAIGQANGLPVDGQGRLDLDLMDDKQQAFMKKHAPDMFKAYAAGDTAAADSFLKSAGSRYDPDLVERTRETLRGQFNSNQAETLVGRDADNILRAAAKQKVADDEMATMNSYAPNSTDALGVYDRVVAKIPELIDKNTGWDALEDVQPLRDFAYEVMSKGVNINGKWVTPSQQDLEQAISTAEGGLFTDSQRAGRAKEWLIKTMKENHTLEKMADSEERVIRERRRKVEREMREARNPSPPAKTK